MTPPAVHGQAGAAVHVRRGAPRLASRALAPAYHGHGVAPGHSESDLHQRLTARQRQVLALVAEGLSNSAIARLLSITERSVVQHVSNIYDQLDLAPSDDDHRRVRAVLWYMAC